jgi:hypothetical protein
LDIPQAGNAKIVDPLMTKNFVSEEFADESGFELNIKRNHRKIRGIDHVGLVDVYENWLV